MSTDLPDGPSTAVTDLFRVAEEHMLEAIKQACLRRTNCTLTAGRVAIDAPGEFPAWPSLLLHTDRDQYTDSNEGRYIIVAAPPVDEVTENGTSVEIRFEYEGRNLIFYSTLILPMVFQNSVGVKIDAWKIGWPPELFQVQRRGFFRVRATTQQPINVEIALTGPSQDLADDNGNTVSRRMQAVVDRQEPERDETTGVLWDISGGGISFVLQPEPPFQIQPGAKVEFSMKLPGLEDALEFRGEITACKASAGAPTLYCVEYRGLEDEARLRRSHNLVLQYIAQREREMLKDLRMAKRWSSADQM